MVKPSSLALARTQSARCLGGGQKGFGFEKRMARALADSEIGIPEVESVVAKIAKRGTIETAKRLKQSFGLGLNPGIIALRLSGFESGC